MMAYFIFAMLTPWVLGFALIRACLKQRYGHTLLALGGGYLIGLLLIILGLQLYHLIKQPVNLTVLLMIAWFIALPVLFFLPPKRCTMEEFRLEKAPANWIYMLTICVLLLLLYRWGVSAISLFNKPLLAWDGWLSLSAKAKLLYYDQGIANVQALSDSIEANKHTLVSDSRSYFISLIPTYTALAWGAWDDYWVGLPWLGVSISLVMTAIGGLRYLGAKLLPSVLTGYVIASLPVLNNQVELAAYSEIWLAQGLLLSVMVTAIILRYQKWRLLFILLLAYVSIFLSSDIAWLFLLPLIVMIMWRLFGGFSTIALLAIFCGWLYFSGHLLAFDFTSGGKLSTDKQIMTFVQVWLIQDNWHYLWLSGVGSLLLIAGGQIVTGAERVFSLLITAGLTVLLMMLWLASDAINQGITDDFNRMMLCFVPVIALIPVSVYQLVIRDEDSLPVI